MTSVIPGVVGVGETSVGKHPDGSTQSLATRVATDALDDGSCAWTDVDGLVVTQPVVGAFPRHALAVAEQFGISDQLTFAETITMGGASAVLGIQRAADAVRLGRAHRVLVVAADTPRTGQPRSKTVEYFARQRNESWEQPVGMLNVSAYALLADEYLRRHDQERAVLANIAVALRRNAEKNHLAAYRTPLTHDDALASRMVSDPLRMIECSPINDGAAAVLVADAGSRAGGSVAVAGHGFATDYDSFSYKQSERNQAPSRSSASAVRDSGRPVHDSDLVMVYDSYSIAMAIQIEALGLCEPGRAGNDFKDGRFAVGGDMPVNTHGGLLSHGHCGGAAGMHHVTELVKQLRGTADNQVPIKNGFGYLQAEGGILSANASLCLAIHE